MPDERKMTAECHDCGVKLQASNGVARCPYCDSWAFRDVVSDGAIYAAASDTTTRRVTYRNASGTFCASIAMPQSDARNLSADLTADGATNMEIVEAVDAKQ